MVEGEASRRQTSRHRMEPNAKRPVGESGKGKMSFQRTGRKRSNQAEMVNAKR